MDGFEFDFRTKVIFGKGAEEQIGKVLGNAGIKRVMLHYDTIAQKLGILEKVTKLLHTEGIMTINQGGVRPNPSLALVREGIANCCAHDIECVVAIGGGSVIDSAKAIAIGAKNPLLDIWTCYDGLQKPPEQALKMAVISTTAATGSETNASSVLSNDDTNEKRSLYCDVSRATYAFMNPELLYTLPQFQRRCTIADIYVHTHERYCADHGNNRISDECSEGNMRVLLEQSRTFIEQPQNYQAASEVMWAGSFAYMCCGLGGLFDWSTHNLAHEISGHYHECTHAATVTAIWGSWAEYTCKHHYSRFAQYARNVFQIEEKDETKAAIKGITQTIAFFKEIGMPTSIPEMLGRQLSDQEIEELADSCTFRGRRKTIGKLKELNKEDMLAIYKLANIR